MSDSDMPDRIYVENACDEEGWRSAHDGPEAFEVIGPDGPFFDCEEYIKAPQWQEASETNLPSVDEPGYSGHFVWVEWDNGNREVVSQVVLKCYLPDEELTPPYIKRFCLITPPQE